MRSASGAATSKIKDASRSSSVAIVRSLASVPSMVAAFHGPGVAAASSHSMQHPRHVIHGAARRHPRLRVRTEPCPLKRRQRLP